MKFSLPSLSDFLTSSKDTFQRFPLVIITAIAGTTGAMWLAGLSFDQEAEYTWLYNLCFTCALGIPLLTGLKLYTETMGINPLISWLQRSAGLLLLVVFYFSLGDLITEEPYLNISRFFLYFIAAHFFVAFSPFLKDRDLDDFWNYNKTLFLNLLYSAVYSAALFIGLTVALLSVDQLLEISVEGETYLQLWFFMVGIFNTWFFLSHFPEKDEISSSESNYPAALKVFAQYVLIPIVSVYIIILYAYMAKIIIQWEWPNGWVANLVLVFSITGIFSLLLLYPFEKEDKNKWIRTYSKVYYFALIPLIILLSLSIWTRISDYGITVNRYFVVILALWLTGFVIYSILSRSKNIKVIPVSLCITALVISIGPWGAFSVSENSQKNRLEEYLDYSGYLNESGLIQQSATEPEIEDRREISSIVTYLIEFHGLNSLQDYFEESVAELMEDVATGPGTSMTEEQKIMALMEIEYVSPYNIGIGSADQPVYVYLENRWAANISGYDQIISDIDINVLNSEVVIQDPSGADWGMIINEEGNILTVSQKDRDLSIEIPLTEYLDNFTQESSQVSGNAMPYSLMHVTAQGEDVSLMIIFHSLNATLGDDPKISSARMDLLVGNQ